MPATYGSMRLAGSPSLPTALLLLAFGAAACSPYAPANPLTAGLANSAVAPCPAIYSFEDGSLGSWFAPTWPLGTNALLVDTLHPHCGKYSMHINVTLGGSKSCVVNTFFNTPVALTAVPVSAWIYFSQAPPASVQIQVPFIAFNGGWAAGALGKSGFSAGWNQISGTFTSSPTEPAIGIEFDLTNSGAPWSGDVWIDDLTW